MIKKKIIIWESEEYNYLMSFGFIPNITAYLHEDKQERPAMLVVPGGGYTMVTPTEGEVVAKKFYGWGYQVFVLTYTTNLLLTVPLKRQPMEDLSRAIRYIRKRADEFSMDSKKLIVCGFSAGAHLCGSVCVHYKDIHDPNAELQEVSNRPDAAILSYPVITTGIHAHTDSFRALLGENVMAMNDVSSELEYMSLEKHVDTDTPPCFLWHTLEDETVPVENSELFVSACKEKGVRFALHIFSRGTHGLSTADEEWVNTCKELLLSKSDKDNGSYTMEQLNCIVNAVKTGILPLPDDKKELVLSQFQAKPEQVKQLENVLKPNWEVAGWTQLAKDWIENI